jgi:uncharacterized membrane protein
LEALLKQLTEYIALGVEGCAALFILYGALESIYLLLSGVSRRRVRDASDPVAIGRRKWVWLVFARWLVLALEFELAADILRTAISPTWNELGQLAVIAVIRTFLNYFLSKDMKETMALKRAVDPDAFLQKNLAA